MITRINRYNTLQCFEGIIKKHTNNQDFNSLKANHVMVQGSVGIKIQIKKNRGIVKIWYAFIKINFKSYKCGLELKDATLQCFEEGILREKIFCGISKGSESLHLHNILIANFKSCKCGLELEDTTLQCFEEGILRETRELPIFCGIPRRLKKDATLQCFEEGILRETRGLP